VAFTYTEEILDEFKRIELVIAEFAGFAVSVVIWRSDDGESKQVHIL
jgi:hypothetical protein